MDSPTHPLLHFLVRIKQMSRNVFLQVAKNVEVTRGKIWAVWRMLKCFPVKSLKLIPHQIGSMGTGIIMQMDDSVWQYSGTFWLYGASQYPQPPRSEPHLSALLCLPPMLDEHNLHYALQTNKETTVWTMRFHYACLLPYGWQYRYVTTVLPVFLRGICFMAGVRFSFDSPYILMYVLLKMYDKFHVV